MKPVAAAETFRWRERTTVIAICLALFAAVWLVYGQTLRFSFVNFDDGEYIYESPRIVAGLTLPGVKAAFAQSHADNWHPLTTLSHMLDCQLYGLQPWGHHLTNVFLHAAAAVLLFLALRALTLTVWPSALTAAIFALHPLRVESVAWVSERKDVLSAVFFALGLWTYARYTRGDRRALSYTALLLFFLFGLLSKPTLVTFPFLLFLLDYWPLGRRSRSAVIEKLPLFLLSLGSCIATLLAQQRDLITVHQLTYSERFGNAFVAYLIYLWQLFVPVNLAAFYPYPHDGYSPLLYFLAFLFVAGCTAGCFFLRLRYPFLLVGWLWFVGLLVPMIGLVQVGAQAHADRYTYLSGIGLIIALVWSAFTWLTNRRVLAGAAAILLPLLGALTFIQAASWKNSRTLWSHALATTKGNYVAENNLGKAFLDAKNPGEAEKHFRRALEIYPAYPEASNNLAVAQAGQGDWSAAAIGAKAAVQSRPGYAKAHSNLGVTLAESGHLSEALREFEEALRLDPSYVDAHANAAHVLLLLGRREEARDHLRTASRLAPADTEIQAQLEELQK